MWEEQEEEVKEEEQNLCQRKSQSPTDRQTERQKTFQCYNRVVTILVDFLL